jgi:hypothetical protein
MEAADFRAVLLASELMPDLSGSGNAGTPTNMEDGDFTTDVPGGRGFSWYSMTLDGVNEYVTLGDAAELKFAHTDEFSVLFWAKWTSVTGIIISKTLNSGTFRGWYVACGAGGALQFQLRNDNGTLNRIQVTTVALGVNDGAWHQVGFTWDGTGSTVAANLKMYVDGVELTGGQFTVDDDNLSATIDTTAPFVLGSREGLANFWAGQMDDAAIYDKALTLGEVQAIYNSGVPVDNRTLSTVGNLVGYWGCGDAGPGGVLRQVMVFDGVTEYLDMGAVHAFVTTDPRSIEFWIKTTTSSSDHLVNNEGTFNRGWSIYVRGSSTGVLVWEMINLFPGTVIYVGGTAAVNDGNWYHCVVTWDGNATPGAAGTRIYVNAVEGHAVETDTLGTASTTSDGTFQVGSRSVTPQYFDGMLAGVNVYDRVLTQAEVTERFNNGIPVDSTLLDAYTDLVGYWSGEAGNTGAMTNMVSGDIEADVPQTLYGGLAWDSPPFASSLELGEIVPGTTWKMTAGAPGGPTHYFQMRAEQDPGPGFEHWTSVGAPDFAGTGAGGPILPGTAIVTTTWSA